MTSDNVSTFLLKFATSGDFHQYVNFETHGNNILDLLLVHDRQIIDTVSPSSPIGHSYHCILFARRPLGE